MAGLRVRFGLVVIAADTEARELQNETDDCPKREKTRERRERRFDPQGSTSSRVVYLVGAIGAIAMGAGAWGQFGALVHEGGPPPLSFAPYILAVGALHPFYCLRICLLDRCNFAIILRVR